MAEKNSLQESISQFALSGLVLLPSSLEIMRSQEQFRILKTSNVPVRSERGFHLFPLLPSHTSAQLTPIPVFSCGCCCSVAKSCLTLSGLTDCGTPGFPVLHYLPELAHIHVHVSVILSNHLILCLCSLN